MRMYCRICWNTRFWREPTGEAANIEAGKTHVREHGFGHEEWLFNFSWLQSARGHGDKLFKYGFLQPIGRFRRKYEGEDHHILVYTVTPDGARVAVAEVTDVFVPDVLELDLAVSVMQRNGWLAEMKADLQAIDVPGKQLDRPAADLINVRFEPSKVRFFDPRIVMPHSHKVYRINRYQPLRWDDAFPAIINEMPIIGTSKDGKRRSELERLRQGVEGRSYSPMHARLQNALYDHLCGTYGKAALGYERAFVDLTLHYDDKIIYFEVKTAPTAKGCIREAIGQLLEYGVYPGRERATKLIVVGDGPASASDIEYLQVLRNDYRIPVFYRRWKWESRSLGQEV